MSLTGAEGNCGHRAAAGLCELSLGPTSGLSSVLATAVGTAKLTGNHPRSDGL